MIKRKNNMPLIMGIVSVLVVIGVIAGITGFAAANNSSSSGTEVALNFAVDAWKDISLIKIWGDCSSQDASTTELNDFCQSKGYAGIDTANPCYQEWKTKRWTWNGKIPMINGTDRKSGMALTKVRCAGTKQDTSSLPDLKIEKVTANTNIPKFGDYVIFKVKVFNSGAVDIKDNIVIGYGHDKSLIDDMKYSENFVIQGGIKAHESKELEYWIWIAEINGSKPDSPYNIYFKIDRDNRIKESDEGNNIYLYDKIKPIWGDPVTNFVMRNGCEVISNAGYGYCLKKCDDKYGANPSKCMFGLDKSTNGTVNIIPCEQNGNNIDCLCCSFDLE